MIPATVRLFNPKGPDRVAVVSVQPSASLAGAYLIQLARGAGPGPLKKGTAYGPYPEAELDARFAEVVEALKTEGFLPTGVQDLFLRLASADAAVRARAAIALGWRRSIEAVEPILAAIPKAVDEICSYLDALGAIGDARAIPVLREQAGRKLLSRRRSAVEALRNLGDTVGLAAARQQALERLPAAVRVALDPLEQEKADPAAVVQVLLGLETQHHGLALDTLYELATPLTVAIVRDALAQVTFDQPHFWRYVKSIYKRALLRHDHAMFGWLSHALEIQGRASTGSKATVKSGYDGVSRPVHIFGRATQSFMRRLSWRYLRMLASHRPAAYPDAAAEALIVYAPEDSETPKGLHGQFASCYLLHRILWGASQRFEMSARSLRFRFRSAQDAKPPPANLREEAYPHLWDANPHAYLRILGAARLVEAHAFAVRTIETRHPRLLQTASNAEILAFLQAPYEPTVHLGLKELERRFDPQHPDWLLLDLLLKDDRPTARDLGERWLRLTAPLWNSNLEQILVWLTSSHGSTRAVAAELTVTALRADPALRPGLAKSILDLFLKSKVNNENADGLVKVAREALLDELAPLLALQELLEWIGRGPEATLAIAGELLGRRAEPVADVGLERLALLAQHDIAAVRAGAQQWIRRALPTFRDDPSLLLALVESVWEDTRQVAVDLLRATLRPETLDLEGLMGLLDSSQVEVQNLGQEYARRRLSATPQAAEDKVRGDEMVYRLVQHPHPNMRRFALELAFLHLPEGAEPLTRLQPFFRAALFDLWPDRQLKRRLLDFLVQRGLRDEPQAAVAAHILGEVVRVEGRGDFESALEGLVRLKLAYPDVAAPITLKMEEVA